MHISFTIAIKKGFFKKKRERKKKMMMMKKDRRKEKLLTHPALLTKDTNTNRSKSTVASVDKN